MSDIDVLTQAVLRVSLQADAMESAVDELQDALHRLQEEDFTIQQREERLKQLLADAQRMHQMNDMVVFSQNQRAEDAALWSKELFLKQRHQTGCRRDSTSSSFVIPNTHSVVPPRHFPHHTKRTSSMQIGSAPTGSRASIPAVSCASSQVSTANSSSFIALDDKQSSSLFSGLPLWRQALTEDEWEKIKKQKKKMIRGGDLSTGSLRNSNCSSATRHPFVSSSASSKRIVAKKEKESLAKKPLTSIFAAHHRPNVTPASKNAADENRSTKSKCTKNTALQMETPSLTPPFMDAIATHMDEVDQQVLLAQRELAFLDRTSLRSRMRALQSAKTKALTTPITEILGRANARSTNEHHDDSEDEEEKWTDGDANGGKVMFEEGVEALWSCDPVLSSLPASSSFLPFVENLLANGTQKLAKRYEDAMHLLATNVKHEQRGQEKRSTSGASASTSSSAGATAKEVPNEDPFSNCQANSRSSTSRMHLTKDEPSRKYKEDQKMQPGGDEDSHRSCSSDVISQKEEASSSQRSSNHHPQHLLSNFLKDTKVKVPNANTFSVKERPPPPSSSPSVSLLQEEEEMERLAYLRSCYAYAALLNHDENKDVRMVEELQQQECENLNEDSLPLLHMKTIHSLDDVLFYNGWVPVAGDAMQKNEFVRSAPTNTTSEECLSSVSMEYDPQPCASAEEHLFLRQKNDEIQEEKEMFDMFTSIFSGEDYACLPSSWPWMKELCGTPPSYLLPPFHTIRVPRLTFNDVNEHLALIKLRMDVQRRIAKRVMNGLKLIDIPKDTLLALSENSTSQHSRHASNKITIKDVTIAEARLFLSKHRGCRDPYAWTTLVEDEE